MTEIVAGTAVPKIRDIIESISDFVTRQEQCAANLGATVAHPDFATPGRSTSSAVREDVPSLFDDMTPARAASSYSRSAAAKRADQFRKAVYLLAILCV